MVRLGVTGHRQLDDDARVVAAIDGVLDDLGGDGTVVSSLAEGADRLVVWRALRRPGWQLVVVLPLAPDEYADDFESATSRHEMALLLDAATEIEQVPPEPTRLDAYLAAGRRVLARSDALVAVWDGAPARGRGGTAEIVAEARAHAVPLAWIHADAGERRVTKERWPWAS